MGRGSAASDHERAVMRFGRLRLLKRSQNADPGSRWPASPEQWSGRGDLRVGYTGGSTCWSATADPPPAHRAGLGSADAFKRHGDATVSSASMLPMVRASSPGMHGQAREEPWSSLAGPTLRIAALEVPGFALAAAVGDPGNSAAPHADPRIHGRAASSRWSSTLVNGRRGGGPARTGGGARRPTEALERGSREKDREWGIPNRRRGRAVSSRDRPKLPAGLQLPHI